VTAPGTSGVIEVPGPWQHRYVAANGARFHVVQGTPDHPGAPLVLLLHGFPEFWWAWREVLPALTSAGYRAAAMDLRGYGGSDKPPRGYDPFTLAADVAGVVKGLGGRSAILVGHGWGGYVGWATATMHPREVAALCAVSAPHPLDMLARLRSGARRRVGALGHLLAMQSPLLPERRISDPRRHYVHRHLSAWSSPASGFPDEAVAATYQEAMRLWPAPHCALEYHRWLVRSRVRTDGRRFNAVMSRPVERPVCTVHGADDPAVPENGYGRTHTRVAGPFEQHLLTGAGHFPHEETPEAFTSVLLGWLDALPR